jgi:hypothetical protein
MWPRASEREPRTASTIRAKRAQRKKKYAKKADLMRIPAVRSPETQMC